MAVAINSGSLAETTRAATTFTMSLVTGWDQIPPERGGRLPVPGDLIVLEVRKPETDVIGPSGWTALGEFTWTGDDGAERTGSRYAKIIMPGERDPVFTSPRQVDEWEVHGLALTGYPPIGGAAIVTVAQEDVGRYAERGLAAS